mgnify:CR=1 FL=1
MRYVDVFNGDADGICALLQLQLDSPRDGELVTGVKRDIDLLRLVDAGAGDRVTVLDVAMESGFSSVAPFYAAFAAHTRGLRPLDYRRQHQPAPVA